MLEVAPKQLGSFLYRKVATVGPPDSYEGARLNQVITIVGDGHKTAASLKHPRHLRERASTAGTW